MSQGQERNSTPEVILYTQEQLDAAVTEAVKFVNECNLRQSEVIETLRTEINVLKMGQVGQSVITQNGEVRVVSETRISE